MTPQEEQPVTQEQTKGKTEFDFDALDKQINKNYTQAVISVIRHPEQRKEWEIPMLIGEAFLRFPFYTKDSMDCVLPVFLSRVYAYIVEDAVEKDNGYELNCLWKIFERANTCLVQLDDQYMAKTEYGVFYQSFAKAFAWAGDNETAEEIMQASDDWFDWQEETHRHRPTTFHKIYTDAERGNADAQFIMAISYQTGSYTVEFNGKETTLRVEPNPAIAREWFAMSAINGNQEARQYCDEHNITYRTLWW